MINILRQYRAVLIVLAVLAVVTVLLLVTGLATFGYRIPV